MFFEPNRTPYDLSFRLLGFDVRVHPLFWIFTALLGWELVRLGFQFLLLWVLCVFFSILLHELGHAVVGRIFGSHGHIVLYSFGGLAIGSNNLASHWQRIGVSLAGPLVQLLLYGFLFFVPRGPLLQVESEPFRELLLAGLGFLLFINKWWALLNLLPVWPLDGGQISRELFGWLLPKKGLQYSLALSVITAGLLAIYSLLDHLNYPVPILSKSTGGLYTAVMFGMLGMASFQALQQLQERRRPGDDDADDPWRGDWR